MNTLRYIVVLPAGVKQCIDGKWASTELSEADALTAPGGVLRLHAAALIAKESPDIRIITGGGLGYDVSLVAINLRPTIAEILQEELTALGVDKSQLIFDNESQSTFQELGAILGFVKALDITQLEIITSRYHVPRVKAMIESKYPELGTYCDVVVLSAEDILLERAPDIWKALIEDAYQSEWMHARISKEQQGVAQIQAGTYNFR